jgi:hypothetical protein
MPPKVTPPRKVRGCSHCGRRTRGHVGPTGDACLMEIGELEDADKGVDGDSEHSASEKSESEASQHVSGEEPEVKLVDLDVKAKVKKGQAKHLLHRGGRGRPSKQLQYTDDSDSSVSCSNSDSNAYSSEDSEDLDVQGQIKVLSKSVGILTSSMTNFLEREAAKEVPIDRKSKKSQLVRGAVARDASREKRGKREGGGGIGRGPSNYEVVGQGQGAGEIVGNL